MRPDLLATVALSLCAGVVAPAASAPGTAWKPAGAGEPPDCPRAECPPRRMGMPNWECADGRRGGPVCKRGPDGACGWMVVDCPAAESHPPPAPPPTDFVPPPSDGPVQGWIPAGRIQETAGPAAGSADRLVGASTLRPFAGGFVSLGGSELRHLAPGAQRWTVLQRRPGDSVYRLAVDEAGERLLVAWEKDPHIHLFALRTGDHASFPRPPPPRPRAGLIQLDGIAFSRDGGSALVFMAARDGNKAGVTAVWRAPLDGSGPAEEVVRQEGAILVARGSFGAVFALPPSARQPCMVADCFPHSTGLVAYEVTSGDVTPRTLLSGESLQARKFKALRTQDPELVAIEVEQTRSGRSLLLYRPGKAPELRALPPPDYATQPTPHAIVTRGARELVHLRKAGVDLVLRRLPLDGAGTEREVRLPSPVNRDSPLHGLGLREDGSLWLHWGDYLALVGAGGALRGVDLGPVVGGGAEWAGVAVAAEATGTLWLGVEVGAGRDYVRVQLAEMDRRAKGWPERPKECDGLPDVATLLRWPVQEYGGCSGGIPNPRAPKRRPPDVILVLPDGSKIIDAGERGCIRAVQGECNKKCLPPDALIATPLGDVRIDALEQGMPVWTRDREGTRVAAVVVRTHRELVPATHRMVRLRLSDGRTVLATPGHPGVAGVGIERLRVGDDYDGARVVEAALVASPHGETRDLLPSGETGIYWAEGVPLGSTLR